MTYNQLNGARTAVSKKIFLDVLKETTGAVYRRAVILENVDAVDSQDELQDNVNVNIDEAFKDMEDMESIVETIVGNPYVSKYMLESVGMAIEIAEKKAGELTIDDMYPTDTQGEIDVEMDDRDKEIVSEFIELKSEDYAEEVNTRIAEVLATEKELSEIKEQKLTEVIQAVADIDTDEDNPIEDEETKGAMTSEEFLFGDDKEEDDTPPPTEESIYETAVRSMSALPDTVFQAIVSQAGRIVIRETVEADGFEEDGIDMEEKSDEIIGEAIVEYTLIETFNTLGLVHYNRNRIEDLKHNYFMG